MMNEETIKITTDKYKSIHVSVFHVQRCNFNDERLIESLVIPLSEIKDKPLFWFDPYLGKFDTGKVSVAISEIGDETITMLEKRDGGIKKHTIEPIFQSFIISDDFDKSCIIAAHIQPFTSI